MNSIKIASELSQTAARGQQQLLTRGGDDSDQILRLKKYFLPGRFGIAAILII